MLGKVKAVRSGEGEKKQMGSNARAYIAKMTKMREEARPAGCVSGCREAKYSFGEKPKDLNA